MYLYRTAYIYMYMYIYICKKSLIKMASVDLGCFGAKVKGLGWVRKKIGGIRKRDFSELRFDPNPPT